MVSCISGFSYCGGKLTEARRTVFLCPQGYPVMEWGHLTRHKKKGEPREKITVWIEAKLTSTTFFACLCLHYIVFISRETWECPTSTYYTCIALHWATVWPLTATAPHSYPGLSDLNTDSDEVSARSVSTWKPQCEWVIYLFDNFPVI